MSQKDWQWYGTGRRKESVARVFLRPGGGQVLVNKQPLDEYFVRESLKQMLMAPLTMTENAEAVDAYITVKGGGKSGQAGAIRLGLSRALCEQDPNQRELLKKSGFLTRDARVVERKKYGQPGARKRFQFSKR
jgi:small subunit ribosomal protein S9